MRSNKEQMIGEDLMEKCREYISTQRRYQALRESANPADVKLLDVASHFRLTEDEKIAEVISLCKAQGANIDAQVDNLGTALHRSISAGAFKLAQVLIGLGANVSQASMDSKITPLGQAVHNFHCDTHHIVEALCQAGAQPSEVWENAVVMEPLPCDNYEENWNAYYESIKILLKYSRNLKPGSLDWHLQDFIAQAVKNSFYPQDFEIIGIFISYGANLFCGKAAKLLLSGAIHSHAYFEEIRGLFENISLISDRLNTSRKLSELCHELLTDPDYAGSPNLCRFKDILDNEIQSAVEIRTVSRVLAVLFLREEENILNALNPQVLVKIASFSTTKPNSISQERADKLAYTFFSEVKAKDPDGHEKKNSDPYNPEAIISRP